MVNLIYLLFWGIAPAMPRVAEIHTERYAKADNDQYAEQDEDIRHCLLLSKNGCKIITKNAHTQHARAKIYVLYPKLAKFLRIVTSYLPFAGSDTGLTGEGAGEGSAGREAASVGDVLHFEIGLLG